MSGHVVSLGNASSHRSRTKIEPSLFDHEWVPLSSDSMADLKPGDILRMGARLVCPGLVCEVRDLEVVFPPTKEGVRHRGGLGAFPLKGWGKKQYFGIHPRVADCWEVRR